MSVVRTVVEVVGWLSVVAGFAVIAAVIWVAWHGRGKR